MSKLTKGLIVLGGAALLTLAVNEATKTWQSEQSETVTGLQTFQTVSVMGALIGIISQLLKL